jgi:hypothetical protein
VRPAAAGFGKSRGATSASRQSAGEGRTAPSRTARPAGLGRRADAWPLHPAENGGRREGARDIGGWPGAAAASQTA